MPDTFENLDTFSRMLILKVLNPTKLMLYIKHFIKNSLGSLFIESPAFDLTGSYTDSSATTPIIFVLSPGADPMVYLLNLAKEKEMDTRIKILSLG